MPKRKVPLGTMLHYNRVLKRADYELFNVANRKGWEVSIALKTLRELGAVHADALILGVGAAKEPTIYHLSNEVRFVFATDLYLDMNAWTDWLGKNFLINPAQYADDIPCNPQRIIPQHVDMTCIPYPDNTFDGVFSSGSIEHVGQPNVADYQAIAQAAREIGRVTKPGGIISLSTEWKLAGEGWGWGHVRLFTEETLMKYIVEPSGCELADEPDWSYDGNLKEALDLGEAIRNPEKQIGTTALREQGYVFTSVHVALQKPS